MIMKSHDYRRFASEYALLGIEKTFYLGFRDLPLFLKKYSRGTRALDFGCGTGRSTRFLENCGYIVKGVDKNSQMIAKAKKNCPEGIYEVQRDKKIPLTSSSCDVILLFAVLMEISSKKEMKEIFFELFRVLKKEGVIIIVTDAEKMYEHDCASFIYKFPENREISSGMQVKLKIRDTNIVFHDYYWTQQDYAEVFCAAGLKVEEIHKPLATGKEPWKWYSETLHPHFAIYVLKKCQ